MDKEVRDFRKAAKKQGWKVEDTTNGVRLTPPDTTKPAVEIHNTNSDHRWVANTIAQLRRSGLIWPPPTTKALKKIKEDNQ